MAWSVSADPVDFLEAIVWFKKRVRLTKFESTQLGVRAAEHAFWVSHVAQLDIVHIAYKGVAPATTDLISGQVQMLTVDLNTLAPHVKLGRMRPLAVTGAQRSSLMPDLPTIAEAGVPGYEASGWFGMLAPTGTPSRIVRRLNGAIGAALSST